MVIMSSSRSSTPTVARERARSQDMNIDNNEYDFINSQEGIPARFELANAYCKMGDYKAARKIYKDIVNSGDQSRQRS